MEKFYLTKRLFLVAVTLIMVFSSCEREKITIKTFKVDVQSQEVPSIVYVELGFDMKNPCSGFTFYYEGADYVSKTTELEYINVQNLYPVEEGFDEFGSHQCDVDLPENKFEFTIYYKLKYLTPGKYEILLETKDESRKNSFTLIDGNH